MKNQSSIIETNTINQRTQAWDPLVTTKSSPKIKKC